MAKQYIGARLRRLRTEHGISQVEMGRVLDLSTSYVNQLENDQRPVTVAVLVKLTSAFDVEASYFTGDSDARLVADVRAALAGSGALGAGEDVDKSIVELVARFPGVGRHLVGLTRRLEEEHALVSGLVDPQHRAESLERAGTAPREHPGAGGGRPTANQFDYERVRDFFYSCENYVGELDVAAEALAAELDSAGAGSEGPLADRLLRRHGITVVLAEVSSDGGGRSAFRRRYDPVSRTLTLPSELNAGQRAFQLAAQLAFLEHGAALDALVADAPDLEESSRPLARVGLAHYFAGAVLLPYSDFLGAARQLRYDVELLAQKYGLGFETICHRLSTLQRRGNRGVPFILLRTDRAGNISKRQSATAFHFSRTGGSCPLWVVHRAFDTPGRVMRQLAEMPDGRRYLWIARSVSGAPGGFGATTPEYAVGLGCAVEHAHSLVYSRGLDVADSSASTPIGAGCRVCDRADCRQRAFPRTGAEPLVDENLQTLAPYSSTV